MVLSFPLNIMELKVELLISIFVIGMIFSGIVAIPEKLWHLITQLLLFTIIVFITAPYLKQYIPILDMVEQQPITASIFAIMIVFAINLYQILFPVNTESFVGDNVAIGQDIFKKPRGFCPPDLNFVGVRDIDTDTEPQSPVCLPSTGCSTNNDIVLDLAELTEENHLDQIDIYLNNSKQSIHKINKYLKTSLPDQRWLSKAEMDNPENSKLNNL